jgi:hypothetical protein
MTTYHTIVSYALKKVGPMTTIDLAKELEMREQTAREAIRRSKESGKVHVHSWVRGKNNCWMAVFAEGAGPDVSKPGPKVKESNKSDGLPVTQVRTNDCGLRRHPMLDQIAALSDDFRNPFATAMANVSQGERA